MLVMQGTPAANSARDEADLSVAIGARFEYRIPGMLSEFGPNAKIFHFDIEPGEIS